MGLYKKKKKESETPVFIGYVKVDEKKCIGCAICMDECPMGAIHMSPDNLPIFEVDNCIGCAMCVNQCLIGAICEIEY